MPRKVSLRALASELRLAVSTVSEALRDSPKVHPATKERVRALAERRGYEINPVLSAAMSVARHRSRQSYVGTIAAIDVDDAGGQRLHPFKIEVLAGARARAAELGFALDFHWALEGSGGLPLRRLRQIIEARGTPGVIVLSLHIARDFSEFDFSRLSAVQMDLPLLTPKLHSVMPDHTASMIEALTQLTLLGYKRVGLVMERYRDRRIGNRWASGFRGFFSGFDTQSNPPPLLVPSLNEQAFRTWFRTYRPDVVVAHDQCVVDWIEQEGARVPDDVGYVCLNWSLRRRPCAGLDLRPALLGATAVERVVDMIHRRERGTPAVPMVTNLPARWVDGATLHGHPVTQSPG